MVPVCVSSLRRWRSVNQSMLLVQWLFAFACGCIKCLHIPCCWQYAVKRKAVVILRRFWQGESWRCLHFELRFSSSVLFTVIIQFKWFYILSYSPFQNCYCCDREKYHSDAKRSDWVNFVANLSFFPFHLFVMGVIPAAGLSKWISMLGYLV